MTCRAMLEMSSASMNSKVLFVSMPRILFMLKSSHIWAFGFHKIIECSGILNTRNGTMATLWVNDERKWQMRKKQKNWCNDEHFMSTLVVWWNLSMGHIIRELMHKQTIHTVGTFRIKIELNNVWKCVAVNACMKGHHRWIWWALKTMILCLLCVHIHQD